MKNYINEFGKEVALDGEWEMSIDETRRTIKSLKFQYARKNSTKPCKIALLADTNADHSEFWTYFIICWVDGILKYRNRIKDGAYLYFSYHEKKENLSRRIESATIFEFFPKEKVKKERKNMLKLKPSKKKKSNFLVDILFDDEEEEILVDAENKIEEENPNRLLINILDDNESIELSSVFLN